MSETLQGVGLFALSFLGFGVGTFLFGVLINDNEYDDTGVYCGAWLIMHFKGTDECKRRDKDADPKD